MRQKVDHGARRWLKTTNLRQNPLTKAQLILDDVGTEKIMSGNNRLVTIFGGSGFLGRNLVRNLAKDGWRIRVAVRRPTFAHDLKPLGKVGQISIVQANLRDADSIMRAVDGADAVINLVAILKETGRQRFPTIHHQGALWVAQAAERAGVERMIHVSALGAADDSPSAYARTKKAGEDAVLSVLPDATIVRPSILFGQDDSFFNRLGNVARMFPLFPVIGGDTKVQPLYVGDAASAIQKILSDKTAKGRVFELGGPEVITVGEASALVNELTERRRPMIPVPNGVVQFAARFVELVPGAPITRDQAALLNIDNVVSDDEGIGIIGDLGITPTTMEAILPSYMWRFRRTGEFETETA